jgi:hypothetical protein
MLYVLGKVRGAILHRAVTVVRRADKEKAATGTELAVRGDKPSPKNDKTNNRKSTTMKFMISWQFHQGKLHEGYSKFFKMTPEQDAADRGSRIKQIGRWHDLARGRGVVICESDSAEAVANWALNWNSLLDADVVPVLDDDETRALGKTREKGS